MKIYLASSWKNQHQPIVLATLQKAGHEVYDFRNPVPGYGFNWREIDAGWESWDAEQYIAALSHPIAENGYRLDWDAMCWADVCVLLLPCGRSAHLEAGYFVGARKQLLIHLGADEPVVPELMYKMADSIHHNSDTLKDRLKAIGGA